MPDAPEASRSRLPVWAMLAGALILGLGLAGAGFLIGRGFEHGRSADRYVTVKGLAETFVTADLAVWPLRITATGDDLARVQEQIDARSVDRHQVSYGARDRAGGDPAAAGRGHRSARAALPAGRGRRQPVHRRPDDDRAHRAGRSRRPAQPADRRAGQARRGPGRHRRADLPVHPSERDQAGAARRGDPQRTRFRPSSSPPIPAARSPRSGAPRRACSRSCRAIPRPVSWSRTRSTRRSGWSARSSTGWPTDARGDGRRRSYGRQNGLAYSAHASARVRPMSRSM